MPLFARRTPPSRASWAIRRGVLLGGLAVVVGCTGDRYRIVEGPARLSIGGTAFTPAVLVEIEEGGRAFFGPPAADER